MTELNTTVRLYWRILSDSCDKCLEVAIETQNSLLHSWPPHPTWELNRYGYELNATTTKTDNQNGTCFVDVTLFLLVDENVLDQNEGIEYVYCRVDVTVINSTNEQAEHNEWKSDAIYLELLDPITTTTNQLPILPTDSTTELYQTTVMNHTTDPFFNLQNTTSDIASSGVMNVPSSCIACGHYLMVLMMFLYQVQ